MNNTNMFDFSVTLALEWSCDRIRRDKCYIYFILVKSIYVYEMRTVRRQKVINKILEETIFYNHDSS